jgi:hypothetical protein
MTNPNQFDLLVAEMEKAASEVQRLKDAQKIKLLTSPESDLQNLETAITYWESRKCEVENQLRMLR